MGQDVLLHLTLPRYFRGPLDRMRPWMRVKVLALLAVWQVANLAGFVWQGVRETAFDGARPSSP